ncbi:MAG: hypothetical protein CVU05_08655, partial [Bacteroidetes bacterium HGW-Bacteroidetes-21]
MTNIINKKINLMKKLILPGLMALLMFSCNQGEKKEVVNNDSAVSKTKSDSLAAQPITETKVTPELLWKFGRIGETQLSPDGKTIALTITRYSISENKSYTDIYTLPSEGGELKRITGFSGPESNVRWMPDGKSLLFLAMESESSQIWKMNPDGSNAVLFSEITGDINSFEISPDGKNILYCKDVKIDDTPQDIHPDLPLANVHMTERLMYRHWNAWSDDKYSHIFFSEIGNEKIKDGKDIMDKEPFDAPLSPYFDG